MLLMSYESMCIKAPLTNFISILLYGFLPSTYHILSLPYLSHIQSLQNLSENLKPMASVFSVGGTKNVNKGLMTLLSVHYLQFFCELELCFGINLIVIGTLEYLFGICKVVSREQQALLVFSNADE